MSWSTNGRRTALVTLLLAGAVGLLARLPYVLQADFPLHDGGLFYVMVRDLQQAHYRLPVFTSYNGLDIPYAYPPLGFYVAGLVDDLTPLALLDVFRWLPLVVNLLTIGAFYLLARGLLRKPLAVGAATAAFAVLPRSFEWLIMGGGVTRAFGFGFAVLALAAIHRVCTRGDGRSVVLAALCAGGAALSHPEMAWFVAYSSVLVVVAYGQGWRTWARVLLAGMGAAAVAAPWWGTVLLRHGIAPFLASGQAGWNPWGPAALASLMISEEHFFPIVGALAFLGAIACLAGRCLFLPVWVLTIFLVAPRSSLTAVTVPLGLLAGLGLAHVLMLGLGEADPFSEHVSERDGAAKVPGDPWRRRVALLVVGYALLYTSVTAGAGSLSILTALPLTEREAMEWVASATGPDATFVVITGEMWARDKSSEWFPALSERRSLGTVQGYEWLGHAEFWPQVQRSHALERCARAGGECLEAWLDETGASFTHVYVAKRPALPVLDRAEGRDEECCAALRAALGADPRYRLVFENDGAAVFARVE